MAVLSAAERARLPKPHGRLAVWATLRQNRETPMTTIQILDTINRGQKRRRTDKSTVSQYLLALERGGFVEATVPEGASRATAQKSYRLTRDFGPNHPKLSRSGNVSKVKANGRLKLWQAMKALKTFDIKELTLTTGMAEQTAIEYVRFLERAEYLKPLNVSSGRPKRWRFRIEKWTGPQAPVITHVKALFDPNLGEIVYARHGADKEACDV